VTWLPDWDRAGTLNRLLPDWALELSRTCPRYTFATMQVHEGRAVVATLVDGTGPMLVVTRNEDEMRRAIGCNQSDPS
jgi:hypothetical protein